MCTDPAVHYYQCWCGHLNRTMSVISTATSGPCVVAPWEYIAIFIQWRRWIYFHKVTIFVWALYDYMAWVACRVFILFAWWLCSDIQKTLRKMILDYLTVLKYIFSKQHYLLYIYFKILFFIGLFCQKKDFVGLFCKKKRHFIVLIFYFCVFLSAIYFPPSTFQFQIKIVIRRWSRMNKIASVVQISTNIYTCIHI